MPLKECRICHDLSFKLNDYAVDLLSDFEEFATMALNRAEYARSIGATGAAAKLRAISTQMSRCAGLAEAVYETEFSGHGRSRGWTGGEKKKPFPPSTPNAAELTYPATAQAEVEELFLVACQDIKAD